MKKRVVSLLLTTVMAMSLFAGCGQKETSTSESSAKTSESTAVESSEVVEEVAYEDLPTINVLWMHGYTYQSDDNLIWKEVAKKVGAKINFIGADTDKYNTMVASGDGFDILQAKGENMNDLSKGNILLPLDDLLEEYGSNIKAAIPSQLNYAKATLSGDTGKLYWIASQETETGRIVGSKTQSYGLLRWDYYKEMGYPETNSVDDYLLLIKDMQELHPTNEAGQTVYGMAIPSDRLLDTMKRPFLQWNQHDDFGVTGSYDCREFKYINFYDEEGSFWDAIDFFHKAYLLGLLDPDSFAMKEEDLKAKATDGRLLTISFNWQVNKMNGSQGFMAIPKNWAAPDSGTNGQQAEVRIPTYGFAINKNSEYKEICMKYIDFLYSWEGVNLIYNGIEGVHWVEENGVRSLTPEAMEMYNSTEDTIWEETGLYTAETGNFSGLLSRGIAPDGKTYALVRDASLFVDTLTDVEKDYCEYYEVSYPNEIMLEYIEKYDYVLPSEVDPFVKAALPIATDEIKQIEAALNEEAESMIAELIMASEADYEKKVANAKERLEHVGLSKVIDYFESNWQSAIDTADELKKYIVD